ncbi:MAG TPA: DUF4145 domain-containing protein [candidate division Zixibacteria bacterium]|nr:DUF4145 domain-containing protein [candidate division Zixibacteria bacterium]
MEKIEYYKDNGNLSSTKLTQKPDKCPACGNGIDSKIIGVYEAPRSIMREERIFVVFRCPVKDCRAIFSGLYKSHSYGESFYLDKLGIMSFVKPPDFSPIIKKISSKFRKIYYQAKLAESNGLLEICGCGYRRSLEFLIRDYLIFTGEEESEITKLHFSECIKRIDDTNIKTVAQRAAWLGNDATHYYIIWKDYDLTNLKELIELTINWIVSVEMTKKYKKDMQ